MNFFGLRHVATGQLMPEMLHRKGYSNWSPGVPNTKLENALSVPRMLSSLKAVRAARGQWVRGIVTCKVGYDSFTMEHWDDLSVTNVGRKTDDLVIVEFTLTETQS